jgi:hypothetical protein
MGRELCFYSFSLATWRAHRGSRSEETAKVLRERLATSDVSSSEAARRMESLATVLNDSLPATTEGAKESAPLSSLACELLTIGQTPQRAPDATHFWYALSQICLRSGTVERGTIEGPQSIVTDRQTRIVARYLDEGRTLFGDALDSHGIYGWLEHGDETEALERMIASPTWSAYVAPHRYKATGVPAFEKARAHARAWVASCTAAEKDIFFAAYPLSIVG